MRKFMYLLIAAFSSAYTYTDAQITLPHSDPYTKGILLHQLSLNAPVYRGSSVQGRLIGFNSQTYSTDPNTVNFHDSARYYYGPADHVSYLDNSDPDTYTELIFNAGIYTVPSLHFFRRPAVGFDSAYSVHEQLPQNLERVIRRISRNYTSGLLTLQRDSMASPTNDPAYNNGTDRYTYIYNADSQVVYADYFPYNVSYNDGTGTTFKAYNTGNLVKDSSVNLREPPALLKNTTDYTYDQNGHLASVSNHWWIFGYAGRIVMRDSYVYTANNLLLAHLRESRYNYNDSLVNDYLDSFSYTGGRLSDVTSRVWDPTDSLWSEPNHAHYEYHYNAAGNVDTILYGAMSTAGFSPQVRTVYTYTAGNHLDRMVHYTAIGGLFSNTPDLSQKFYYELMAPATIRPVHNSTDYAFVYPNPAADKVFIQFRQPLQSGVEMQLFNAVGQMVNSDMLNNTVDELQVAQLPAGSYFVLLNDGVANYRLQFIKQ